MGKPLFIRVGGNMLTQEQIDKLIDMYGLEWVDYIEYVNEGKEE